MTEFSLEVSQITPFTKEGAFDYLMALVILNVRRDGRHPLGDNIQVRVQLPPGSEKLPYEDLIELAAKEAFLLLRDTSELQLGAQKPRPSPYGSAD